MRFFLRFFCWINFVAIMQAGAFTVVYAEGNQPDTSIVFTPEEKAYLASKGIIKMCVDPNWMPFESINARGRHIGIAADVVELLAKRGGLTLELIPTKTWDETMQKAESRACDILSLAASTPGRQKFLNFTTPFFEVQSVIATLMQAPFISDISEMANKKLGVIRGYSHVELLRMRMPSIEIVEIDNYHEGLLKVQSGVLHGVVGNMASIGYSIQLEKMNNVKIAGRIDGDVLLSIATRNDEPLLGSIFEKLVRTLTLAEKQALMNKWMGVRYEHTTDYSLLLKIVSVILIIGIAVAIWLAKVRQFNRQLQLVNRRLEELNAQKDYYFSVIGHDLRNPFMGIVGYSAELKENVSKLPKEEISRFAGLIEVKSGMALQMLNQLLEWARLELNQFTHTSVDVDVYASTAEAVKLYQHMADTKEITIQNTVPEGLVLKADSYMFSTILRNLISNAIKYCRKGDVISLGYDRNTNRFWVSDTGVGMDSETVKNLFSLTPRKSTPGTANEQGTGLGLTICHRYAKEMHCNLTVDSHPGKGTTFYLSF